MTLTLSTATATIAAHTHIHTHVRTHTYRFRLNGARFSYLPFQFTIVACKTVVYCYCYCTSPPAPIPHSHHLATPPHRVALRSSFRTWTWFAKVISLFLSLPSPARHRIGNRRQFINNASKCVGIAPALLWSRLQKAICRISNAKKL